MPDKWKLKSDFVDAYTVATGNATVTTNNAVIQAFTETELNKLSTELLNAKDIKAEDVERFLTTSMSKVVNAVGNNALGGVLGYVLLIVSLLIGLPSTMGNVSGYWSEVNLLRRLRKHWRPQLLNAIEYVDAYRRGTLDKKALDEKLANLGISDDEIAVLLKVSEAIPQVQDVIRFAVREAYTPEIAQRFGQYEGAEDVFKVAEPDLTSIGLSKDNFAKYWASHWDLPSIQQAFEMLHRQVITGSDMDLLLRAQDVMPFWRDKIKAISYNPLTRVDVRRMHKLGVLNDSELLKAYRDIGYDDINAQRLADFTIKYNENSDETDLNQTQRDKGKLKDLTKTDILKNYSLGMIDNATARAVLYDLGYDYNEIDFMIAREDFTNEMERTDTTIGLYRKAFLQGAYTETQALSKLGQLNLPAKMITKLVDIWKLEASIKVSLPTKAEILGFLKKGTIQVSEATNELKKLGYADKYIQWYLKGTQEVEA